MKHLKVEFKTSVPDGMTEQQIEEWLYFELGATVEMQLNNPMIDNDISAEFGSLRVQQS